MSVYQKKSENPKQFDSDTDFLKFYEKHREEIDDTNTKALNLKFKISNFRIGRKDGKLILYPTSREIPQTSSQDETLKEILEEMNEKLSILINLFTRPSREHTIESSTDNNSFMGVKKFSKSDYY